MYALRPPLSVEDTPSGRVPFTYHFSYERLPFCAEHCCANGSIGPLDVLPAGGTLRSPYYQFMREHLGLPTDHLFEIVDPRHPHEPLLLDLSGSLQVMCAHREEENPRSWTDDRVVLLRGVTQAGDVIHGHSKRATLTLGWVDLEFPYYWGTSNRMVLLIERDRETVLPDKTRLTVALDEFLSLCGWTSAAEVQADHYRSEFNAGRVPTFAETEAMIRFPPSEGPGVYGVYSVIDDVAQLVDLADDDTMREEYRNGLGLAVAPAPKKKAKKVSAVPPLAEVSRVHNVRYSGADMSNVRPRFDPVTLEPDPRLLQIAPIWQDKYDCRPWAELRDEMDELIHLRTVSYMKDSARPAREVLQQREDTDRALAERRRIYGKRAQDALTRGSVERERPDARASSATSPPTVPPRTTVKRGRSISEGPVVLPKRRSSQRSMTSSTGSVARPVPALESVVVPLPDRPALSGEEDHVDNAEALPDPGLVGNLSAKVSVLAEAVESAATVLEEATRQLQNRMSYLSLYTTI